MCGFLVITGEHDPKDQTFQESLQSIQYRGPDNTTIEKLENGSIMAFHRLSIRDLSDNGNQPFLSNNKKVSMVCNGEIYNYTELKTDYIKKYEFQSSSDCEVIIPIFQDHGIEILSKSLDAEYAFVLYDSSTNEFFAARDPIGIRPMFYGYHKSNGEICFASEAKALTDLCNDVSAFPPGHYYADGKFHEYYDVTHVEEVDKRGLDEVCESIHDNLVEAVKKRMVSDRPVGFLLSGGLDSSLVCSIANRLTDHKIVTFAIGINENPIDTKYAKVVADYLESDHHEVLFTREEMLESLEELIYKLETWDITTIRASVGMYLLCKYIKEKTDIRVILTGEVSDEIFGYKYTDFAPSPSEFQKEATKRVKELYMYDVLRADRCISSNSLEARVPFSDKTFVNHVMSIDPKMKMNSYGQGKYILRKAFEGKDYLPDEILFREKAAFSDAVGHAMVDTLKAVADEKYSDEDVIKAKEKYSHGTPFTKESLMYREIFERVFEDKSHLIKDFWMPNKEWENCDVDDPSARALPNYGASGS